MVTRKFQKTMNATGEFGGKLQLQLQFPNTTLKLHPIGKGRKSYKDRKLNPEPG